MVHWVGEHDTLWCRIYSRRIFMCGNSLVGLLFAFGGNLKIRGNSPHFNGFIYKLELFFIFL